MDELELSKIVGVGCAAMLAFVGLTEVSHGIISMDNLEEPAYAIEVVEAEEAEVEEAVSVAALMASADSSAGQKEFRSCKGCHQIAEDGKAGTGPNLWGIVGRDIASAADYGYSSALSEKEGVWDWDALNAFLTNPKGYAAGTKMAYNGIKKDAARANLMAWLNEQSGEPIPLPAE